MSRVELRGGVKVGVDISITQTGHEPSIPRYVKEPRT